VDVDTFGEEVLGSVLVTKQILSCALEANSGCGQADWWWGAPLKDVPDS